MLSRPTLTITLGALAIFGFGACKTVYSDTFTYKKNSFKAPAPKVELITEPILSPDGSAPHGGAIPPADGIPGGVMPDAGAIPGLPGAAPDAPAVPAVPAL
jgi:hypothetical protein